MRYTYFDTQSLIDANLQRGISKLRSYRASIAESGETNDDQVREYALFHAKQPILHEDLTKLKQQFKKIKHMILVGIGGQSLGVEAVHKALGEEGVTLHNLDTIAPYQVTALLEQLRTLKRVGQLAVVVSSKSGATAETLINAGVLLEALAQQFGQDIYQQTIFIGTAGTDFLKTGKRLGVTTVTMPPIVGGRYSIGTEAGLVPLALLGHDTDRFISGLLDATNSQYEPITAENAARLYHYLTKRYTHYNFFAFDPRLETLGAWYRQLTAESLGKAADRAGKPVKYGFLPTVSTPVELHSIGQLYLSGFAGVYTDFVTFDDSEHNFKIPKKGITRAYGKFDMQAVATALYGGVVGAYQDKQLPYRSTIFEDDRAYAIGLFMSMRMLETMYLAELMNLNAFDQPNVESYKVKTREILGL